ncbi:MAG TPA: hypothetical protein VL403_14600, partial [Candidatus Kryptonia bacterium]|nr:hypothetical protein [Candidatus Kryptonia bacterium]
MHWGRLLSPLSVALLLAAMARSSAQAACPGDCPVAGGGTTSVDCLAEYFAGVDAGTVADRRFVRCQDGAACDQDGTVNGSCTFAVRVCLNQDDPGLPTCTAKDVSAFSVRKAASDAPLSDLQSKVQALLPATTSTCTDATNITVALGGTTDRPLPGRKRIVSEASGDHGRDFDTVELTCMPPPRPLGLRHFVINPDTSPFFAVIGVLSLPVGSFQGYLDLQAGIPDENGIAQIDVVGSSDYIFAEIALAGMTVCLKPMVPAIGAGVVACKGQLDVSYAASVDHVAGIVGQNGFTADDCTAIQGTLGHGTVEGPNDPHPGTCNGPINFASGGKGDSGRGAVAISPDPRTGKGGLPFELSFVHPGTCSGDESVSCASNGDCVGNGICEQNCGDGPPGQLSALPFVSGPISVQIFHVDAGSTTRSYSTQGENFSCPNWTATDGPGRLVFGIPQLYGFSLSPGQT